MRKIKKKETIILGADHTGFGVKEFIKQELLKMDYPIEDVGTMLLLATKSRWANIKTCV